MSEIEKQLQRANQIKEKKRKPKKMIKNKKKGKQNQEKQRELSKPIIISKTYNL